MATSSASSSTTSPTFVIANISNLVSIKLDRGNYLLWQQQFLPVLFGHDLMGYIDGSKECPSKFIKNADGTITDTLDSSFLEWMKQDRHLLSWIQATLTEGVLAQVVGLQTSRDVWVALERRYASLSRAHISQLTTQLQTIKKRGMTIIDYMNKIKAISDNWRLSPVNNYFWRNDVNFNLPSLMNLPPSLHKIILSKTILAPIMAEGAILTMAGDVEEDVVVMAVVEANLHVTTTQMQTVGNIPHARSAIELATLHSTVTIELTLHVKGVLLLSAFKQWWQQLLPPLIKLGMLILEPPTT
uniref:Uncharacterized protein n=1 Tax=Ananas comosus var. bracteatus TaxID=296719 RepID=A0A6V7PP41_ANACO|nr:unnamed protein product [Ananas comosus var. bracteatus]